ncbi:MAG: S1 family peptidase [Ruminococcus sp.]|nr:S1 family peptidase [Ruminococcus sp.]
MEIKKYFSIKMLAVVSAFVLLIISLTCYNSFDTNAGLSQRSYLRYDYKNPNAAPYQYTISVPDTVFENTPEPYTIFPPNDMVRDYDTSVVRLSIGGTGFIIGKHTIVTAGHCVYDINQKKFDNFTIDIVGNDNSAIKTITPHYVHVPKNFADLTKYNTMPDIQYDYALIYVEEDLSAYGMFNMGICLDKYIDDKGKVIVSGFPQKYPSNYNDSEYGLRFKASGNIISSENNGRNITYDADATNGDSGGPVYVNESYVDSRVSYDYNTVVAINVSQFVAFNAGVRINFDILYFCYQNANLTA